MLTWYVRVVALILFLVGLAGFTITKVPNVVQLDLFQSFLYVILGGVGLKIGFSATNGRQQAQYARVTGAFGLGLMAIGLTLPNLFDLFHLEVPEHIWHGALGLTGSLVGEHYLKRSTKA